MAFIRKIKASMVRQDSSLYVGEDSYLFYDIEKACLRIHDGTPYGRPACATLGITESDTHPGYLADKLLVGDGLIKTIQNPAGDATLTISAGQATINGTTPINNQDMFVLTDTNRNKQLSVETMHYSFTEHVVTPLEWIQLGPAADARAGIIMPFDGTIIRATVLCTDTNGNSKTIDLYLDSINSTIGTLTGPAEQYISNNTLDIDFTAGQKLRARAGAEPGNIDDTIVTIYVKWRA